MKNQKEGFANSGSLSSKRKHNATTKKSKNALSATDQFSQDSSGLVRNRNNGGEKESVSNFFIISFPNTISKQSKLK